MFKEEFQFNNSAGQEHSDDIRLRRFGVDSVISVFNPIVVDYNLSFRQSLAANYMLVINIVLSLNFEYNIALTGVNV